MAINKAFNFLILAAVLLAGVSIFLIYQYVESEKQRVKAEAPTTAELDMKTVYIAKIDIKTGTELADLNVQPNDMPAKYVPATAVTKKEDIEDKVSAHFIPAGDILMQAKVTSRENLGRAAQMIPKGKRLVTISVNSESSSAYLIKNGDYVDLVGIFNGSDDKPLPVVLMQRLEVFDIQHGNEVSSGNPEDTPKARMGRGNNATFIVTPKEAEIIRKAEAEANQLTLLLRRPDDEEIVEIAMTPESERILKQIRGEEVEEEIIEEPEPDIEPEPEETQREPKKVF